MNEHKISAGTIARTIILALALINQGLTMAGIQIIPIADEDINNLVSIVWTIAAAVAAWWKNNSFTTAAIEGDKAMKKIKSE